MIQQILSWATSHPQLVGALSTVLLALFAAVQIGLAIWQRYDSRSAARTRALGPAWLARRNCEAALVQAIGEESAYAWRGSVGSSTQLDSMQANMLQMLEHAAATGGQTASAGKQAFSAFLGFADCVTNAQRFQTSATRSGGYAMPSEEDRRIANATVREAVAHLRDAVSTLEKLAPRRSHEPDITELRDLPLTADEQPGANPVGHHE